MPPRMSQTSNFSCLVRPIRLLPWHALLHRPRTATTNLEWKRVPPGKCNRMEMESLRNLDQPWVDSRLSPITRILTLGRPCLGVGRIQQLALHRRPRSLSGVPPLQIHLHRKILSQKNRRVFRVSVKPLLLPLLYPPHSALVNKQSPRKTHQGFQRQDPFPLQPLLHRQLPPLLLFPLVQQIRILLASQHRALRPAVRLRLINHLLLRLELRPLPLVVVLPSDLNLPRLQGLQT